MMVSKWNNSTQANRMRVPARRGTVYVVVLATVGMVTAIGLTTLVAQRVQRRLIQSSTDASQARVYAQSAAEIGLLGAQNTLAWRTDIALNGWVTSQVIGDGVFSLTALDPVDGDLVDSLIDPVVVTGVAMNGQAQQMSEVTLEVQIEPVTCLQSTIHAGTDVSFGSIVVDGGQVISANNAIDAVLSEINVNVEAVVAVTGGNYNASKATGVLPRTMPDATVFDYYIGAGTSFDRKKLNSDGLGRRVLENVVLSPTSNSYTGNVDANGIYVINCNNEDYVIRDCRIVGTLVMLDAASVLIESSVFWEPAVANYPSLLLRGNATLATGTAPLREKSIGVNLNPVGTPFNAMEDSDLYDAYPSELKGLFYVTGGLSSMNSPTIQGVVIVGGTFGGAGALDLEHSTVFFDNPPPGFFGAGPFRVAAQGWKRAVN